MAFSLFKSIILLNLLFLLLLRYLQVSVSQNFSCESFSFSTKTAKTTCLQIFASKIIPGQDCLLVGMHEGRLVSNHQCKRNVIIGEAPKGILTSARGSGFI